MFWCLNRHGALTDTALGGKVNAYLYSEWPCTYIIQACSMSDIHLVPLFLGLHIDPIPSVSSKIWWDQNSTPKLLRYPMGFKIYWEPSSWDQIGLWNLSMHFQGRSSGIIGRSDFGSHAHVCQWVKKLLESDSGVPSACVKFRKCV